MGSRRTWRRGRSTALIVVLAVALSGAVLGVWRPWVPATPDAPILAAEEVVTVAPTPLVLPEHPRVLVFGDSWTYGSAASSPTLGYAYVLAELLDGETVVDGVRGSLGAGLILATIASRCAQARWLGAGERPEGKPASYYL